MLLGAALPSAAVGQRPSFRVSDIQRLSDSCGLASADVTSDGRRDLIAGRFFGGGVLQTMPSSGGGRFGRVRRSARAGLSFLCVEALVDVDGDGRPDAVGIDGFVDDADETDPHQTWTAYGKAGGKFASPTAIGPPRTLTDVALTVADLDSDGRPDIAALEGDVPDWSQSGTRIRIYENLGKRRFRARRAYSPDGTPLPRLPAAFELLAADLDRDGAPDLVSTDPDGVGIGGAVLLAAGPARFRMSPLPPGFTPHDPVRLDDINSDGRLDLIATTPYDQARGGYPIVVATGDGAGGFSTPAYAGASLYSPDLLELPDLDGDSRRDVISADATGLVYYKGDGHGAFDRIGTLAGTSGGWRSLVFADFNHDRRLDIAGEWGPINACEPDTACGGIRVLLADRETVRSY